MAGPEKELANPRILGLYTAYRKELGTMNSSDAATLVYAHCALELTDKLDAIQKEAQYIGTELKSANMMKVHR